MKKKVFTSLGLMTGTSMDGVDLSIIKSDGYDEFTAILDKYYEFDDDLRKKLINLRRKIYLSSDLKKYSDELQLIEKKLTLFHSNIVSEVSTIPKKKFLYNLGMENSYLKLLKKL